VARAWAMNSGTTSSASWAQPTSNVATRVAISAQKSPLLFQPCTAVARDPHRRHRRRQPPACRPL
jgi:hypothetical protein